MKAPKWTLYLGRKSCPPSRPLLEHPPVNFPTCSPPSIRFPGAND